MKIVSCHCDTNITFFLSLINEEEREEIGHVLREFDKKTKKRIQRHLDIILVIVLKYKVCASTKKNKSIYRMIFCFK